MLDDKFLTDEELKKKYPERQPSKQKIKRAFPYAGDKNPGKPTQKPTMTREEQIEAIKPKKSKGPRVGANPKDLTIKGGPGPKGKFLKRMNKGGAAFPDLSGDGKVTKKDILIGRGVIKKSRGGGIAVQGTGFKGVY